jgi:hypothetical protein
MLVGLHGRANLDLLSRRVLLAAMITKSGQKSN